MKKLLYVFAVLIAAVACEDKKLFDLTKVEKADSAFASTVFKQDFDGALALVDSFEQAGVYTPLMAMRHRGDMYGYLNNYDTAEVYYRKALEYEPQNIKDSLCYFTSVCNVAQIAATRMNFEGVLKTALPLIEELKNFQCEERYDFEVLFQKLMLYTYVGEAQHALNKVSDAEKSYEQAFQVMNELIKTMDKWSTYSSCISAMGHIVEAYLDNKQYDKAAFWQARIDDFYKKMPQVPESQENYIKRQKGYTLCDHMRLASVQNKTAEARQYYEEFSKTEVGQSAEGQYRIAEYLMANNRYGEAANAFVGATGLMKKYENSPSFEFLSMQGKKYMANYKAGRIDSALVVATDALANLDSTIARVKRSEAAKLATIYETQQKDEEIAQQQIELNRQRFLALAVALVLITAFFIVYTLFRRRAARRMAEMKAQQERIESELRIARDIQMSMVPSIFPDREGLDMYAKMTPAKEVGGDLYGYVLIDDQLYFAVGDVSGKGVPASLFMAQATRLFRTLAAQGMMPAEICTRMNAALTEDNEQGMFVTFFLGLLDLPTGHLSFCNAGHNPPIIGGGDNRGDFMQIEANAPIGLFPGIEYQGEEIESIKGQALFAYTDGLNEAEDTEQNQFGDEKLLEILRETHFESARQVIEVLGAKVEEHRKGAEPNDDLTMLCLRVS